MQLFYQWVSCTLGKYSNSRVLSYGIFHFHECTLLVSFWHPVFVPLLMGVNLFFKVRKHLTFFLPITVIQRAFCYMLWRLTGCTVFKIDDNVRSFCHWFTPKFQPRCHNYPLNYVGPILLVAMIYDPDKFTFQQTIPSVLNDIRVRLEHLN